MAEPRKRLADGRMAEYVSAHFDKRLPDDPEDQVPVLVTVLVDGVEMEQRVFLGIDVVLPHVADKVQHTDGQHRE